MFPIFNHFLPSYLTLFIVGFQYIEGDDINENGFTLCHDKSNNKYGE